jgi:hypothetical protein
MRRRPPFAGFLRLVKFFSVFFRTFLENESCLEGSSSSFPSVLFYDRAIYTRTSQEMANDIEMARVGEPKKGEAPEDTDYRPVNWRRIFLTPKYIRRLTLS